MAIVYETTIGPNTIDYNGHMNVAHYGLHFEDAACAFFSGLDISRAYRERTNHALFAVESYFSYRREAKLGDRILFEFKLVDLTAKALHVQSFMYSADKQLLATHEEIYLHMSLELRKPVAINESKLTQLRDLSASQKGATWPPDTAPRLGLKRS